MTASSTSDAASGLALVFPAPALAFDAQGDILAINPRMARALDLDGDELRGKKAWHAVAGRRKPNPIKQLLEGAPPPHEPLCMEGEAAGHRYEVHVVPTPALGPEVAGMLFLMPMPGVSAQEIALLAREVGSVAEGESDSPDPLLPPPGGCELAELIDAINRRVFAAHELAAHPGPGRDRLDAEIAWVIAQVKAGELGVRTRKEGFGGAELGTLEAVDALVEALASPVRAATDAMRRLAAGELSRGAEAGHEIGDRGEVKAMMESIEAAGGVIGRVVDEVERLLGAARRRGLGDHADASHFPGEYRRLARCIDQTLDAFAEGNQQLSCALERMAGGDLNFELEGDLGGDIAELQGTMNRALTVFNDILWQVRVAADQVADSSTQISESANNLARGSNEQAATLDEISGQMTSMTGQTRKNSENAGAARELALTARDDAREGDNKMSSMVEAMREIDEASKNVSRIIKVIDEIAFQTNLLALNAAVEAARAGEHGKGFAVVAEEVRNLAARSARAAKETSTMIAGTLEKVSLGTALARETAQALSTIVGNVDRVTDLVTEIAGASDEQARGIAEVNQGLSAVNMVTQQNAATAEESAGAAQMLSTNSEELRAMFDRFVLRERDARRSGEESISLDALPPELAAALRPYLESVRGQRAANTHTAAASPSTRVSADAPDPTGVALLDDAAFDRY